MNYDRNIYNQLEDTILLVEKLQKEIAELKKTHRSETYLLNKKYEKASKIQKKFEKERAEIAEIKEEHKREVSLLTENNRKTIKALKAEHKEKIREFRETVIEQAEEIARLKAENAALKEIIGKNSGNSSKPPSSDGLKKIYNSRKPTGKKVGGQFGHKGYVRKFFDNPTKIIEVRAKKCKCGGKAVYSDKSHTKKQLVDIEIKTNITEYHEYMGICECCGGKVRNRAPINDRITYGNNLKSLSSMLSVEGNVSINRIGQMLSELSGGLLNLSEGTICKWNKDISKLLAPSIQTIKEKLLLSPVLHKDETGIRVGKKLNWFHVLSNDKYSLFYADKKRGRDADTEAGVLPAFKV